MYFYDFGFVRNRMSNKSTNSAVYIFQELLFWSSDCYSGPVAVILVVVQQTSDFAV